MYNWCPEEENSKQQGKTPKIYPTIQTNFPQIKSEYTHGKGPLGTRAK